MTTQEQVQAAANVQFDAGQFEEAVQTYRAAGLKAPIREMQLYITLLRSCGRMVESEKEMKLIAMEYGPEIEALKKEIAANLATAPAQNFSC